MAKNAMEKAAKIILENIENATCKEDLQLIGTGLQSMATLCDDILNDKKRCPPPAAK